MHHPYQSVLHVRPQSGGTANRGVLLLASAGSLLSLDLDSRETIQKWPQHVNTSSSDAVDNKNGSHEDDSLPPKKKQKTDNRNVSSRIIHLTIAPNHQHVVAVTEDKCVHVIAVEEDGSLTTISQRIMPKRPCAIQVLPNNETILLGDKFGDVYSLPLLITDEPKDESGKEKKPEEKRPTFKPAASHLTVHSKRNRDALEAQIRQKNFTPPSKEPLKFQHELLLGHVSLLTDLTFASHDDDGRRNYIITADRDEHIRVSRAPPQAHVIEGFCFGHTEYVSKISTVPGGDLLVSGGGDTWLGVWHWPAQKLIRSLDLQGALKEIQLESSEACTDEVNVSGIWPVTLVNQDDSSVETFVFVSCERVPALFVIAADDLGLASGKIHACALPATPLSLVAVEQALVVSLDVRSNESKRLEAFSLEKESGSIRLVPSSDYNEMLSTANVLATPVISGKETELDDFLYSMANLRKRRGIEEEDLAGVNITDD